MMRAVRDYGLAVLGGIAIGLALTATDVHAATPDSEAPHDVCVLDDGTEFKADPGNCPPGISIGEPATSSLPTVQMDVQQPPARLPEIGAWNTGPVSLLAVACGLVGLVVFAVWPGGRPQQ